MLLVESICFFVSDSELHLDLLHLLVIYYVLELVNLTLLNSASSTSITKFCELAITLYMKSPASYPHKIFRKYKTEYNPGYNETL